MATASVRLAGVGDPPLKLRCAVTRLLVSRPDAASPSLFVARRRTVNEPAAVKVAVTGTVCEVIRPPVQAVNGWKALAGMVVPFRVTARLFGSKVQLASTATL